jgi:hypothetical protein
VLKSTKKACVAGLALTLVATAASGQVYRWTDEHGNKHFGDAPPTANTERVRPQTTPVDPIEAQQRRLETQRQIREFERRDQQAARQREAQRRQQATQRRFDEIDENYNRRMCTIYTDRIEDIRRSLRSGYSSPDRGRDLRTRLDRAQRDAREYCR